MRRAYLQYFSALLLFGANGVVASAISLSSYEIVLLRTLIGSLLLFLIWIAKRPRAAHRPGRRALLSLAVSGAAMGASWMFLYEAYDQVGVGVASLAYYCGPVVVMALSPLLFGERLTRRKICGFAAVLCGMALVNAQVSQQGGSVWGLFCGGMSAVMYAVMVIFNKRAKGVAGLENSLAQLFFGFLTVAVFVGCKQGFSLRIGHGDWLPILALGLLHTGVGCYLYFSSIGALPVQTVAVCGYLEPLSAVLCSVLFLGERLRLPQVLGAALILGGAAFGECASRRGAPQVPRR